MVNFFYSGSCPAGLSIVQSDRITGKVPLKGDPLLKRKVNCYESVTKNITFKFLD